MWMEKSSQLRQNRFGKLNDTKILTTLDTEKPYTQSLLELDQLYTLGRKQNEKKKQKRDQSCFFVTTKSGQTAVGVMWATLQKLQKILGIDIKLKRKLKP